MTIHPTTTVYVDADACPVRDEALKVAERHQTPVKIVSNGGIRPSRHPLVETVIVPEGADAADQWIADRIGPRDVCVTGDIPLAARCVEAGALVVKHNGDRLDQRNIGQALGMRDLMADLRAADPLAVHRGGKGFTKQDRSRFLDSLDRILRETARR
ncbi:MAG: YaiI/YqxD family protein [Alphaproteobacteria bacterium]|nr:YaiI/YqxD family protein [Alphaproteobacteria bacterium]